MIKLGGQKRQLFEGSETEVTGQPLSHKLEKQRGKNKTKPTHKNKTNKADSESPRAEATLFRRANASCSSEGTGLTQKNLLVTAQLLGALCEVKTERAPRHEVTTTLFLIFLWEIFHILTGEIREKIHS